VEGKSCGSSQKSYSTKKANWLERDDWFLIPEEEIGKAVEATGNLWLKQLWAVKKKSTKPDYRFMVKERCCIRCPIPILKYSQRTKRRKCRECMRKGLMVCRFCRWYVKTQSWYGRNGFMRQKGFCFLSRLRQIWMKKKISQLPHGRI